MAIAAEAPSPTAETSTVQSPTTTDRNSAASNAAAQRNQQIRARRAQRFATLRQQEENNTSETTPSYESRESNAELRSRERMTHELTMITNISLNKKAEEINEQTQGDQEVRDQQANSAILWWKKLNSFQEGELKKFDLADDLAFKLPDGTKVASIEAMADDTFSCVFEGEAEARILPKQALLDAQLMSEKEAILSLFEEDTPQRKAIELYAKALEEGEDVIADNVDSIIVEAATANKMITTADIATFIQLRRNALTHDNQRDGLEKATEEQWLNSIDVSVKGKLIPDSDTFQILLPNNLTTQLENLDANIDALEQNIQHGYGRPADKQKLYRLKDMQRARQSADEALRNGSFDGTALEQVQNGTADQQTTAKIKAALATGKPEELLDAIWITQDTSNNQQKLENDKKRKQFLMYSLIALLATLFEQSSAFMPPMSEQR